MELPVDLLLAGAAGGFLAGLMGVGGGVIFVAVLPFIFAARGVAPDELVTFVVANSIFATLFASLSGNITHYIQRRFYLSEVTLIGLSASAAALLVLETIVYSGGYSRDQFNMVIILLLVFMVWSTLRNANPASKFIREHKVRPRGFVLTGIAAGAVAALSGLGGGVIMIPILNGRFHMNIKKAKSISLGVIFISSLVMTVRNLNAHPVSELPYSIGYVSFGVSLPLILMVMIFTPLGVVLSKRLPSYLISYLFAGFLVLVIASKIYDLIP